MVDLDSLALRARRANEWGRLRAAFRIAWLVPLLGVCAWLSGVNPVTCGCMAGLLLVAVVALRWWHRTGVGAVSVGLAMGLVPLAAGLMACGLEGACAPGTPEASWLCLVAGAIAGTGVTVMTAKQRQPLKQWAAAVVIASLTGMLGCVGLGLGGLLSMLAAIAASATLAWIPLRLKAA